MNSITPTAAGNNSNAASSPAQHLMRYDETLSDIVMRYNTNASEYRRRQDSGAKHEGRDVHRRAP